MLPESDNDPAEPIEPTPGQIAAQAAIDAVSAKILRDFPAADPTLFGDSYSAHGSIEWTPRRDPAVDYSGWGDWEAWEFCKGVPQPNGVTKPVSTGGWIAWNAVTGSQSGFEPRERLSARQQAEMIAVAMNDGKPTRVVHRSGAWQRSAYTPDEVHDFIEKHTGSRWAS